MTAQYWTLTGYDMWMCDEVTFLRLTNLNTGEKITFIDEKDLSECKYVPVTMPKIKAAAKPKVKSQKAKVKSKKAKKKATANTRQSNAKQFYPRKNARKKSKYKGVTLRKNGKWDAVWWDGRNKKCVTVAKGFDSDLLAAAAYQEHIGHKKEARRLRNEYQEGDCRPESASSEPQERIKGVYPVEGARGTRYHAQITYNKKQKHLGTYDTPEEAAAVIARFKKAKGIEEPAKDGKNVGQKIEELKGTVTYQCAGCGADYKEKPLRCEKCGSCAIEPVRLAAAAAHHASNH